MTQDTKAELAEPRASGAARANEDLAGRIAVCGIGRIGVIRAKERVRYSDNSEAIAWVGTGLFDGQPWSSARPRVLADADARMLRAGALRP